LTREKIREAVQNPAINLWAFRVHDKDLMEDGTPKPPHFHIELKLKDSYDTKYIAQWFGVGENFVERMKGKKFIFGCRYLIHANAPDKYPYDIEGVEANFDFAKFIKDDGENSVYKSNLERIQGGEITAYNWDLYILQPDWIKNKKKYERAFEVEYMKMLREEKNMKVIFITGDSRVGKTTYAKETAKRLGYDFFIAGASNDPFQGYLGQPCVILDDLRPEEHHISDLLKMTDNYTSSLVKRRYKNVALNKVKLMIITSVHTLEDYYMRSKDREKNLGKQLSARIYGYMTYLY